MTRDAQVAGEWLTRFEGAGLDGVIAKPEDGRYEPGKRAMIKVKHARTADCVVAGFRWHKNGKNTLVGSLLLGLYDDRGALHHVGVTSSFTMARRRELADELEPLRKHALDGSSVARVGDGGGRRRHADAGRPEPVERRQGSVVGTGSDRAGLRGQVRPHAGAALPPCRGLRTLAAGQGTSRLPLRSARGHDRLRAREGVWCRSSSGSNAS